MKKFLSLILAIVMVVGLLIPAVSAETETAETKTLVSWVDGASLTATGEIKDVALTAGYVGTMKLTYQDIAASDLYKNIGINQWYGEDNYKADTQFAYIAFQLSTKGYENLKLSSILGGNARIPTKYDLLYSLDNTNWTKVEKQVLARAATTKAESIVTEITLPAAVADQELVYFRIAQAEAAKPKGESRTDAGKVYLYDLTLTGTVKASQPTEHETVEFAFLTTSDLHGQIYATDYSAGYENSGKGNVGLTRVATYIKQMREKYGDNLFLADIGDTIQGAPLTYYYAFNKDCTEQPAMKAFRTIGYDMWVIGNHEFNYGLEVLNRQLDYLTSPSNGKETQVNVHMANYLDASTNSDASKDWKTWKGYAPYEIKDFGGVKVAIIGIGNPNIAKWDIPENWKGVYFAGVIETYEHYEKEMLEKADMIVVMSHSGIGESPTDSDFIKELVGKTNSISFAFCGHQHGKTVEYAENKDGVKIPLLQPNTKANAISQVLVTYDKTDNKVVKLDAQNVPMTEKVDGKTVPLYEVDAELEAILKPYEETTWKDYMLRVIGKAKGDYPAANLGEAPSAFMDLINKVQILGAYDRTGENTPDDPTDDTPAQLSISAPLTAGSKTNLIGKGDIYLGDMFSLYRFENWFYQITMSGKEVRTWLEFAATKINPDGTVTDLTYYDVIYGDGFSYTLDYAKPEGSRVVKMTYNGLPVADDKEFTVVLNNYRYNGGGNYVNYLNDHGCNFTPNDPDRIIYSTQFDMLNGEDEGQARTLLINYIKEQTKENGGIEPEITSNWKVINSGEKSDDIVILYTNDVHTYIDNKDGEGLRYSDVAGYRNDLKDYFKNILLVDAGDHVQGTAYGGMDNGATILNLMKAAGYDLATLGNHEFDYGMERALEIANNGKIPFVSCNFYNEKDGVKGTNVLDSYKIFDMGGKKVAFVGITTPESFTKSTPKYFQDANGNYIYGIAGGTDGKALYAAVQTAIDAAKAEGADYIIGLAHLGVDESSHPWTSKDVIANVSGFDAVIDGHSHTTMEQEKVKDKNGKEVVLTQTGSYLKKFGQMTITANGEISTKLISSVKTDKDAAVKEIEDQWIKQLDEELGQKIGSIEATLDNYNKDGKRLVRSRETNTGDFAADALYYLFLDQDVDVAIMNGGGVRNTAITGDLTYKKLKEIHTFGNVACLQRVTGQQILDALEWGAKNVSEDIASENGGFLQVSGLKYEIHSYIKSTVQKDEKDIWIGGPTGEYRVKNVKIYNKETKTWDDLDLKKEYKLAGYNYTLRDLGDGFAMFKGAVNELDYVMQDYMVLANYVQGFDDGIVPGYENIEGGEGRITFVFNNAGGGGKPDPTPGPKTADETNLTFYMITGVVALVGLGTCVMVRKKKEQE